MKPLREALIECCKKNSEEHTEILKFLKKVDSYKRGPNNFLDAEKKIKKSINYKLISKPVSLVLVNYKPIDADPTRKDYDDYKIFNYCLLVLCFDDSEYSFKTLRKITETAIQEESPYISGLRAYFGLFKQNESIKALSQMIFDYEQPIYERNYQKLESAKWVQKIGLNVPKTTWWLEFVIATEPNPFNPVDMKKYMWEGIDSGMEMKVWVGGFSNENVNGWKISIRGTDIPVTAGPPFYTNGNISGIFYDKRSDIFDNVLPENDEYIHYLKISEDENEFYIIRLDVTPSLFNLNQLMDDIEESFKFKFKRKIYKSYFSFEKNHLKSLKYRKVIDNWLDT